MTQPIWRPADPGERSVFRPEHLLREARRQRGVPERDVPQLCALDPDGDLVRHLRHSGTGRPNRAWACYHTDMVEAPMADGTVVGVVGCAVGAPFAVLVAEQLFASGCRFLVSVTSAGRIAELGEPPYAVLIDAALRDEGTSAHYLPPGAGPVVAALDPALLDRAEARLHEAFPPGCGTAVHRGASWTTDAPYRETATAIAAARAHGALAVEMEASALYAFAAAQHRPVLCFAHVTNTMGQHGRDDFEKGRDNGVGTTMRLIEAAARAFAGGPA